MALAGGVVADLVAEGIEHAEERRDEAVAGEVVGELLVDLDEEAGEVRREAQAEAEQTRDNLLRVEQQQKLSKKKQHLM